MNKERMIVTASLAVLVLAFLGFAYEDELRVRFTKPYWRYHLGVVKEADINKHINFLSERIKTNVGGALDRAALAQIYLAQGRLTGDVTWNEKAAAEARESLRSMPFMNVGAQLVLAQIAESRHDFAEAIRLVKEVLKYKPRDQSALILLVTSHLALGELESAAKHANILVDWRPFVGSYLVRGLVMAAQGRDEEAIFDFKRAIRVEDLGEVSDSARARIFLGRFLASRGKNEEALALYNETLRFSPGHHLALYYRGLLRLKQAKLAAAEKDLMDAFTASKQVAYLVPYARAKALKGDAAALETLASAEKILRTEISTNTYGHRLELAKLLLQRGDSAAAKEALRVAEEEYKLRKSADASFTLARALHAERQHYRAKELLSNVFSSGLREAEHFTLAGKVERALGNPVKALFYFDLALKTDASFSDAEKEKAGLLRDRPKQT